VLQRATQRYSVLQRATQRYSVRQRATQRYSVLQRATQRYSVLQRATQRYSVLQAATHGERLPGQQDTRREATLAGMQQAQVTRDGPHVRSGVRLSQKLRSSQVRSGQGQVRPS